MNPEDLTALLAIITGPGGTIALIILIAFTGATGKWCFGRELAAAERRADEWHHLTLSSLTAIQAAIEALERRTPR